MPREELYLQDIIKAAKDIEEFLAGVSETDFLAAKLRQSAVLYKLANIGEAAARISEGLKNRNAEIEWKPIIGFRNIAVHAYFSVDLKTVWRTATEDVPVLKKQIQEILKTECPDFEPRSK